MSSENKIAVYIAFVATLFLIEDPVIYLLISFMIVILLLRIPRGVLKKGWVPIGLFLSFTFAGNMIDPHGKVVFNIGSFLFTQEGLRIAGLRTARVFFMILGAKILTSTTTVEALVAALGRMLKPLERLGLPVKDFFSVAGLSLKSLPRIKRSLDEACGERLTSTRVEGLWNRMKLVSLFLIPLFVKSMQSPEMFFEDNPGETLKNMDSRLRGNENPERTDDEKRI